MAQFFACFTCLKEQQGDRGKEEGFEQCFYQVLDMIGLMEKQCTMFPEEIALAQSYEELMKNKKEGKTSLLFHWSAGQNKISSKSDSGASARGCPMRTAQPVPLISLFHSVTAS